MSSSSIRPGKSLLPPTSTLNFRQAVVCNAYSSSTNKFGKPAAPSSFYEVLGISVGATNKEIKAAYGRLVKVCHPHVAAKKSL
ncbi:OLC1v1010888C1 [Oldenlandia corymbosa var. corymbosa]|uniref:OLC1v1010888C1 n=1 Tax=Oldenlandia corymbosa var. corymbosa TaxID=529605 RepID=A0AAV1DSF6_OLDCO|nr:OLC1v1010888C1 [Oldenlandia corymbosa var. corymbosa]